MAKYKVFARVVLTECLGEIEAESGEAAAQAMLAKGRELKAETYRYRLGDLIPVLDSRIRKALRLPAWEKMH